MRTLLVMYIFICGVKSTLAQKHTDKVNLFISARVDTSSEDVKSIIALYENYFNSKPDSIYNNPYWNTREKTLYKDFDFSRESLFQGGMNSQQLYRYFSPFIMSVEPIGKKYQIRVLYSSSTTDPKYAGSKVRCIHKVNALKENNTWVLENLMVELSKNWNSKKMGWINYIYPPNHIFNELEAEQSLKFSNAIIQRFNPNYNSSFNYYVTTSKDDMGLLENFDYYFVGITTGKAREGMILTAKGNEYYPHELVHKLIPTNPNRGIVIEEGAATFLGTKENKDEYTSLLLKLATDLKTNPEKINFKSVVSQTVRFNGYQTAYPAGAAICELVYKLQGDEGLKLLLLANTTHFESLIQTVCSITGLTEQELETEWLKIILNIS